MADYKMMIHELIEKIGFDNMRALVKANEAAVKSNNLLDRVAHAVMNRHRNGDKKDE
jgi:hypothetical protein